MPFPVSHFLFIYRRRLAAFEKGVAVPPDDVQTAVHSFVERLEKADQQAICDLQFQEIGGVNHAVFRTGQVELGRIPIQPSSPQDIP